MGGNGQRGFQLGSFLTFARCFGLGGGFAPHPLAQQLDEAGDTHADPDGKGVERTGVGVVALTRLAGRLVQVEHDGDTRHEEQEEHDPELLDALLSAVGLPQQADDAKQQRQTVEHVVPLVFLQVGGDQRLVAYEQVVDEVDARDPVAVLYLAEALDVATA